MRYIIANSTEQKAKAEWVCRRINDALGYRGADPLFDNGSLGRQAAYTGEIILSERAAAQIARIVVATESS